MKLAIVFCLASFGLANAGITAYGWFKPSDDDKANNVKTKERARART
jgi:hypothetical protein